MISRTGQECCQWRSCLTPLIFSSKLPLLLYGTNKPIYYLPLILHAKDCWLSMSAETYLGFYLFCMWQMCCNNISWYCHFLPIFKPKYVMKKKRHWRSVLAQDDTTRLPLLASLTSSAPTGLEKRVWRWFLENWWNDYHLCPDVWKLLNFIMVQRSFDSLLVTKFP